MKNILGAFAVKNASIKGWRRCVVGRNVLYINWKMGWARLLAGDTGREDGFFEM
ncbi:MAG: hypothetical protein J6T28_00935 [Paludibacteraceae bacterium]|nr:hypothetical protein [Paludibacteraceae bacterium]